MAARKAASKRKYGAAAGKRVKRAMGRMKKGTLKSGKGKHPKVKSRAQAIAIGLSEARENGAKVPRKSAAKKSASKKKTASKKTARTSVAKTPTARKSTARKR